MLRPAAALSSRFALARHPGGFRGCGCARKGAIVQEDDLLTIEEAAAYLKLSKKTTWRWCRSGRLPAFKIGHQWRISRADLQELIRAKKRKNKVSSLPPLAGD